MENYEVELALLHRVEEAHLIGDRSDVDDVAMFRMKALESAFWRFGIECPRRQVMRREVVEQRAGDGGFAHASLVRTHHDHRRLRHGLYLTSGAVPRVWPSRSAHCTG